MKVRFGNSVVEVWYSDIPVGDSGSHMSIYFSDNIDEQGINPTYQQISDEYDAYQGRNSPTYVELLKQILDEWDGIPGEW